MSKMKKYSIKNIFFLIIKFIAFNQIKVEKYLTAEQRKQLEELETELAKKREIEKMDNWRDRGLVDMMGGVLQIRREDELKKVVY